jgi:hypothetical protein
VGSGGGRGWGEGGGVRGGGDCGGGFAGPTRAWVAGTSVAGSWESKSKRSRFGVFLSQSVRRPYSSSPSGSALTDLDEETSVCRARVPSCVWCVVCGVWRGVCVQLPTDVRGAHIQRVELVPLRVMRVRICTCRRNHVGEGGGFVRPVGRGVSVAGTDMEMLHGGASIHSAATYQ